MLKKTKGGAPQREQRRRGAVLAALLCGTAAQAQTDAAAKPEATLPAVRVTGQELEESATGPVPGYNARRSATATRTDTPLNEVPQSISVITADQIKDQNAQTMQEVLRYTAGVRSDMYGLDNRGDWFTMRGGSEGSTLLDGLRLPLTGWYGVVRNEPFAFERGEVLRGPASVIAGQNGPGGVVNMVSKRPQDEAMRELSVQLGSHGHKQVAADLTGPLDADGMLLYRLVAVGRDSGTQVQFADEERRYIAPTLTWRPSDGTSLTAYAQYQKDRSGNTEGFFPWAGTLLPAPNGPIPLHTFVGEPDWDDYGGERSRVGYALDHRLDERWSLRHHLRHDRITGLLRSMYANFWEVDASGNGYGANALGANRTIGRTWYATDNEGRITNGDLLLEGRLKVGSVQHTVLVGVDAMSARSSQSDLEGACPVAFDVYAPVYGTCPLPALVFGAAEVTKVRQTGLFVQDQIKLDERWVLVAGLRRDQAKTTVDGVTGSDDQVWSKNIGAVYLAGGGWSPYASYSESFEPVGGTDINGTAFKPKRGKQVEAGVKWAPADQRITASAAVYKLEETGRLTSDPTDPNFSVQRGEATVQGAEFELNAAWRAWDLLASYTYTDAKDEATGKRLSGIARHSAALWAVHRFGGWGLPGLRAGLGVRHVGTTWDGGDTLATPSNTLLDAMLAYERGAWRYALNLGNLADKTYFATCLERGDCWYGAKRKAVLSAAYRW